MENYIKEASTILGVAESVLKTFCEVDPYNNNKIEGVLCRQSDHRYGALVIFKVNDKETYPQVIYATPKLHYPFSSDGDQRNYRYPKFVKIMVYEKLDGTNICCYKYKDADNNTFVTFKTRLTSVLKQSQFGDFKSLWDDMLLKYPQLRNPFIVEDGNYNLSFELYGYRNIHLIQYDVDLETRLLFLVNRTTGEVSLNNNRMDLVPLECAAEITNKEGFIEFYNQYRDKAESTNTKLEDGTIQGTEGYVFYVLTEDNKWILYKVKPESVEEIHWTSDYIPYNIILATAWNVLETTDEVTIKTVSELLKEEFEEGKIMKSGGRIEKACAHINEILDFRRIVKSAYNDISFKATIDISVKKELMRELSKVFPKNMMRSVFTALKSLNLITENNNA